MLSRLKFNLKIIILPALAALGLVLLLVASVLYGDVNGDHLEKIRTGYVPAMEMRIRLEQMLSSVQRELQDAVAAEDEEAVTATEALRDKFTGMLQEQLDNQNPVLSADDLEALRADFVAYYDQAAAVSLRMLKGEAGEEMVAAIQAMRTRHDDLQARLDADTNVGVTKEAMAEAFEAAIGAHDQSVIMISALAAALLVLLVLASIWIIRGVSGPLSAASKLADEASLQIVASVQEQTTTVHETATSVSQTSATIDEIRQTSEMASRKAQDVTDIAEKAIASAAVTEEAVNRGLEAMRAIREQVEGIANNILELSDKSIEIGEIVGTVGGIAEQSNLLAVNASIEAAKAGEFGKGFSVVSQEVKELAGQSKQATNRIREMLADIQKSANAAVMAAEEGIKRAQAGMDLVERLNESFTSFSGVVEESGEAAHQISLTVRQQFSGLEQITNAMKAIEVAITQNAAGAEQLQAAASQVRDISGRISKIVEGDRGADAGPAAATSPA